MFSSSRAYQKDEKADISVDKEEDPVFLAEGIMDEENDIGNEDGDGKTVEITAKDNDELNMSGAKENK